MYVGSLIQASCKFPDAHGWPALSAGSLRSQVALGAVFCTVCVQRDVGHGCPPLVSRLCGCVYLQVEMWGINSLALLCFSCPRWVIPGPKWRLVLLTTKVRSVLFDWSLRIFFFTLKSCVFHLFICFSLSQNTDCILTGASEENQLY